MTSSYYDYWERQNMCVAKGAQGMIGVQSVREPLYHPDNDSPAITD